MGKQRLQSWRAQTKVCTYQAPEERSSDPTGDNPNYLLVLEGLLWEVGGGGSTGAHHRDRGTGSSSLERFLLVATLLEVSINTTIGLADSRWPQAKQLPRREYTPPISR